MRVSFPYVWLLGRMTGAQKPLMVTHRENIWDTSYGIIKRELTLIFLALEPNSSNLSIPINTLRENTCVKRIYQVFIHCRKNIRCYRIILILSNNPFLEDSVFAVIGAGRAYLLMGSNPGGSFNPQMPWLEPVDWEEFDALRWELLSQLSDSLSRGVQGSGEAESAVMPISYSLHQNYPNPFNPVTKIRFSQPEAGDVSLVVYDV